MIAPQFLHIRLGNGPLQKLIDIDAQPFDFVECGVLADGLIGRLQGSNKHIVNQPLVKAKLFQTFLRRDFFQQHSNEQPKFGQGQRCIVFRLANTFGQHAVHGVRTTRFLRLGTGQLVFDQFVFGFEKIGAGHTFVGLVHAVDGTHMCL